MISAASVKSNGQTVTGMLSLRRVLARRSLLSTTTFHSRSLSNMVKVVPVPVREDNYAYLLIDPPTSKAAVVDPFDVPKVLAAAKKEGVDIIACLTTHHHFDHSGGNQVRILLALFWSRALASPI